MILSNISTFVYRVLRFKSRVNWLTCSCKNSIFSLRLASVFCNLQIFSMIFCLSTSTTYTSSSLLPLNIWLALNRVLLLIDSAVNERLSLSSILLLKKWSLSFSELIELVRELLPPCVVIVWWLLRGVCCEMLFEEVDAGIGMRGAGRPSLDEFVGGATGVKVWVWSNFFCICCSCRVKSLMLAAFFFLIELFSSSVSSNLVVSSSICAFFSFTSSLSCSFALNLSSSWVLSELIYTVKKKTIFCNVSMQDAYFKII